MTVLALEAVCSIQQQHHTRMLCRQEFCVWGGELKEDEYYSIWDNNTSAYEGPTDDKFSGARLLIEVLWERSSPDFASEKKLGYI